MRLSATISFVPTTIAIYSEQILSELAQHDNGLHILNLLLPLVQRSLSERNGTQSQESALKQTFLLKVMAHTVPYVESQEMISKLPAIIDTVIIFLSSNLVDLRQCVIILLVEIHRVIGDVLFTILQPYNLTKTQITLLTIFIDRTKNSLA